MRLRRLTEMLLYLLPDTLFFGFLWSKTWLIKKNKLSFGIVLGDTLANNLLFIPICRSLVHHLSGTHTVVLIGPDELVPILKLWIPEATVIGLTPGHLWHPFYRYSQFWLLHRFHMKTVLHPVIVTRILDRHTAPMAGLLRALPIEKVLGYGEKSQKRWLHFLDRLPFGIYDTLLAKAPTYIGTDTRPFNGEHLSLYYYHLSALTYFEALHDETPFALPPCPEQWRPPGPYIVVAPRTGKQNTQHHIGRFVRAIQRIHENTPHISVVIVGEATAIPLGRVLRRHTGPYCIDLTGKTSLAETLHLVAGAEAILSSDPGVSQMGVLYFKTQLTV